LQKIGQTALGEIPNPRRRNRRCLKNKEHAHRFLWSEPNGFDCFPFWRAGGVRDRNAQVVAGRDPDFIQINHLIDLTISLWGLPNVTWTMLMS
jgi:hypothetical protein